VRLWSFENEGDISFPYRIQPLHQFVYSGFVHWSCWGLNHSNFAVLTEFTACRTSCGFLSFRWHTASLTARTFSVVYASLLWNYNLRRRLLLFHFIQLIYLSFRFVKRMRLGTPLWVEWSCVPWLISSYRCLDSSVSELLLSRFWKPLAGFIRSWSVTLHSL
jgi:hypothetical protein